MVAPKRDSGQIVDSVEESVLSLIFAVMVLVTTSQVVARYVFNTGALWALELTTYAFAWFVLLGVSFGVKRSSHLGVDAFVRLFPDRIRRIFGLMTVAAAFAYAMIIGVGAFDYVSKLYRIGIHAIDLPIPRWVPYSGLLLGMALLVVRLVAAAIAIIRGERTSLLADEARQTIREIMGEDAAASAGAAGER